MNELAVGDVLGVGGRDFRLERGSLLEDGGVALARVFASTGAWFWYGCGDGTTWRLAAVEVTSLRPLPLLQELERVAYERRARRPVTVTSLGAGALPVGAATWADYTAGSKRLFVLIFPDRELAWRAELLPRDVEHWGA